MHPLVAWTIYISQTSFLIPVKVGTLMSLGSFFVWDPTMENREGRTAPWFVNQTNSASFRKKEFSCLVFIFVLVFEYFLCFFTHPALQLLFWKLFYILYSIALVRSCLFNVNNYSCCRKFTNRKKSQMKKNSHKFIV